MDAQKVDMYLTTNAKFFEGHQIPVVRDKLMTLDDTKFIALQSLNLKDPILILVVSILAGTLGIDRFLLGDTGLGVAKLLTCGGLGVWAIVDWFLVMGRARQVNFEKVTRIF
jgi:TM2 domain-containing membrane protein YozV